MSSALAGPYLAAAGVLCVSGAAKLLAPLAAARAVAVPGFVVRIVAAGELGLGIWAALAPQALSAATMACAYIAFAAIAVVLARRHADCGCFGQSGAPASVAQAVLSVVIAGGAALAAVWPPGGLSWIADRSTPAALTLAAGLAGCVYGLVIAYTQLPSAWAAWEAR